MKYVKSSMANIIQGKTHDKKSLTTSAKKKWTELPFLTVDQYSRQHPMGTYHNTSQYNSRQSSRHKKMNSSNEFFNESMITSPKHTDNIPNFAMMDSQQSQINISNDIPDADPAITHVS